MSEMIHIKEIIVVEGKYDKAALAPLVDTVIVDTAGFGIFSDREKLNLLRRLAAERGLVIMTDSDGGGFLIRNFLRGAIDPSRVKHAYIPDIYGKERRKRKPSKEGKLGVEGMPREVLIQSLSRAGVIVCEGDTGIKKELPITKAELYSLGLSGHANSALLRDCLKKELDLPEKLSSNALLDVLNVLVGREKLTEIMHRLNQTESNWVT